MTNKKFKKVVKTTFVTTSRTYAHIVELAAMAFNTNDVEFAGRTTRKNTVLRIEDKYYRVAEFSSFRGQFGVKFVQTESFLPAEFYEYGEFYSGWSEEEIKNINKEAIREDFL